MFSRNRKKHVGNLCVHIYLILAIFSIPLTSTEVGRTSSSETNTCYASANAWENNESNDPDFPSIRAEVLVVCQSEKVYVHEDGTVEALDGSYDLRGSIRGRNGLLGDVPGPFVNLTRRLKGGFLNGCDVDIEYDYLFWGLKPIEFAPNVKGIYIINLITLTIATPNDNCFEVET